MFYVLLHMSTTRILLCTRADEIETKVEGVQKVCSPLLRSALKTLQNKTTHPFEP